MKIQVFVDDGHPESREYNDNYYDLQDFDLESHVWNWKTTLEPEPTSTAPDRRWLGRIGRWRQRTRLARSS